MAAVLRKPITTLQSLSHCTRCLSVSPRYNARTEGKKTLSREGRDNIVLIDGVRIPFIISGTDYRDTTIYDLASAAILGIVKRTGIKKEDVDNLVYGNAVIDSHFPNLAKESLLQCGFPSAVTGSGCTMACISSNLAISTGIGAIVTGSADVVIAGGADFPSDPPVRYSRKMRQLMWDFSFAKTAGKKLSIIRQMLTPKALAPDFPAVSERSTGEIMGHSADRLASAFKVTRQEMDEYALRSHTLAKKASDEGLLEDVIPFKVPGKVKVVTKDNGIRPSSMETMSKLKPAFVKPHGTVTAANSSFLSDGASACLIMTEDKALQMGLKPKAYLRDFIFVANDPKTELLLGPAYANARLLKRTGLTLKDFDVFEFHEAFAAQVLANLKAMDSDWFCQNNIKVSEKVGEIPMEKLNTWGGSLSLGHPFAATGVRIATTAANRLIKEDGQFALLSACAQSGQGTAMVIERYPGS